MATSVRGPHPWWCFCLSMHTSSQFVIGASWVHALSVVPRGWYKLVFTWKLVNVINSQVQGKISSLIASTAGHSLNRLAVIIYGTRPSDLILWSFAKYQFPLPVIQKFPIAKPHRARSKYGPCSPEGFVRWNFLHAIPFGYGWGK